MPTIRHRTTICDNVLAQLSLMPFYLEVLQPRLASPWSMLAETPKHYPLLNMECLQWALNTRDILENPALRIITKEPTHVVAKKTKIIQPGEA
jgi:hypothetical protein